MLNKASLYPLNSEGDHNQYQNSCVQSAKIGEQKGTYAMRKTSWRQRTWGEAGEFLGQ